MKKLFSFTLAVCIAATVFSGGAEFAFAASDSPATPAALHEKDTNQPVEKSRWIDLEVFMQSVVIFKNDSDFDATAPNYDKDGQSVGVAATVFQPKLTFNIYENLRLYYELEMGLNVWSKNNPDQCDPTADDTFFMKHREAYSQGEFFEKQFGFKVGYMRYEDPTGLFLNHWMGAASLWAKFYETKLKLTFGQVPDKTYEGMEFTENNFNHDTFTANLGIETPGAKYMKINGGIYSLIDTHVVDRKLRLINPVVNLDFDFGKHAASLGGMLQLGTSEFGVTGVDTDHFAWALQAHGDLDFNYLGLYLNALALSGDDKHNRNNHDGAFFYSGKNKSATLLLTEDELRDKYDNYDERMGVKDGGFYLVRPGMVIADAKVEGRVGKWFRPAFIAGFAMALEPANALGERYMGTELDLDMGVQWKDALSFHIVGGIFLPGPAAAALVNEIDREKTDMVYFIETSLAVTF